MNSDIISSLKEKGYVVIGEGRNRIALTRNKKSVVKIPKNSCGDGDNFHEAQTFKHYGDSGQLAKCKLLKRHILVMEYVKECEEIKELPDWAGAYDCYQVGRNHKGKWRAFDYGRF